MATHKVNIAGFEAIDFEALALAYRSASQGDEITAVAQDAEGVSFTVVSPADDNGYSTTMNALSALEIVVCPMLGEEETVELLDSLDVSVEVD